MAFFGIERGDIIEAKVKGSVTDTYHRVALRVLSEQMPQQGHSLVAVVIVDYDKAHLLGMTYLLHPKNIIRVVRKHNEVPVSTEPIPTAI